MSRSEFHSRYGAPVAFNNAFGASAPAEDKDYPHPVFKSGPFFVQAFFKKADNEEVVSRVAIRKGSPKDSDSVDMTPLEQRFWVSVEFPSVEIESEFFMKPLEPSDSVSHKFEFNGERFHISRFADLIEMWNLTRTAS